MTHAVLLSVKPIYAQALLAGTKTAEIRRRFPAQPAGTVIFVYASSPVRAVLGTVVLDRVSRIESEAVSWTHRGRIEIGEEDLAAYLHGVETASVLEVSRPKPWSGSVSLEMLRFLVKLEPPQSFRYLTGEQAILLTELAGEDIVSRTASARV